MSLRFVILKCPYDHWRDQRTQRLFCKTIGLKLDGYLAEYSYGVLPCDTSDFVGTHRLICAEGDDGLTPIMGWKALSLERCRTHGLVFPPLALLRSIEAPFHLAAVEAMVARHELSATSLVYSTGLTIRPDLRKDSELVARLWEMYVAAEVAADMAHGVTETVCFAAVRFKMNRRICPTGYRRLEHDKQALSTVRFPACMDGSEAWMFHRREFTSLGLGLVEKYRALWDGRLEIVATADGSQSNEAA